MAIGGVASGGRGKSTPIANEHGDYTTQRPTTQQKSSIQWEQDEKEEMATDIGKRVIKTLFGASEKKEKKVVDANVKWEQLLEVNIIEPNGGFTPTEFVFKTDDAYTDWVLEGGPDKHFKDDKDYCVIRIWVRKD